MAKLLGIVERLDQNLYSAWIADTRPDGIGTSNEATFRNPMRLFVTDIGDRRRTNLTTPGSLGCDRTASIRKAGFHISFSNKNDFDLVCSGIGVEFAMNVSSTAVHTTGTIAEYFTSPDAPSCRPTYDFGVRVLESLKTPIAIPARAGFFVELKSTPEITKRMQQIESGRVEEYAEMKSILDVTMTREVQ